MRRFTALTLYRLLLPLLFIAAFPGWLVKMLRRGGLATRLGERVSIYTTPLEEEPCGCVHFHAVSVGESLLALKLIRKWLETAPDRRFVLATGTATGHAVAVAAALPGLRVTYAPLDFHWMIRRYLRRFEPVQIVLIEGEVWPHLLLDCQRNGIPVRLVNARMSPRSARRFTKFAVWLRSIYGLLDSIAIQEPEDVEIWQQLGVAAGRIHVTGSLKFDPAGGAHPARRAEFQEMLAAFGPGRRVILAASTFPGEEILIARAIRAVSPDALPVIVPRHAERRVEVKTALSQAGFEVILRSHFSLPENLADACFVIDSTGELCDWTAHAAVVVIGKSLLATGGQNPCEAILAEKPLICGPHMENFQPLTRRLIAAGGCLVASDAASLTVTIRRAMEPETGRVMTLHASELLAHHQGATGKIIALLDSFPLHRLLKDGDVHTL
jgi:3-deoxy-D-manno-octulosonic-acid transferase